MRGEFHIHKFHFTSIQVSSNLGGLPTTICEIEKHFKTYFLAGNSSFDF